MEEGTEMHHNCEQQMRIGNVVQVREKGGANRNKQKKV